jgi:hypothetical protein
MHRVDRNALVETLRTVRDIARDVVDLARMAPSIHNTQPWEWTLHHDDALELSVAPDRRLPESDPEDRGVVVSCGAALHHARVAAAALGCRAEVLRLPDAPSSPVLARLELTPAAPSESSEADLRHIRCRRTDRRRLTDWPVPVELMDRLAAAARAEGIDVFVLDDDAQRFQVQLLAARAAALQAAVLPAVWEQRSWVDRSPVDGIPARLLPAERAGMSMFLPEQMRHRPWFAPETVVDTDLVVCLGAAVDDQLGRLRVGEGLSALWLEATAQGLALVPLSQPTEVPATREALRTTVLGGTSWPILLVRVGWQPLGRTDLPRTGRRPLDDVLNER